MYSDHNCGRGAHWLRRGLRVRGSPGRTLRLDGARGRRNGGWCGPRPGVHSRRRAKMHLRITRGLQVPLLSVHVSSVSLSSRENGHAAGGRRRRTAGHTRTAGYTHEVWISRAERGFRGARSPDSSGSNPSQGRASFVERLPQNSINGFAEVQSTPGGVWCWLFVNILIGKLY